MDSLCLCLARIVNYACISNRVYFCVCVPDHNHAVRAAAVHHERDHPRVLVLCAYSSRLDLRVLVLKSGTVKPWVRWADQRDPAFRYPNMWNMPSDKNTRDIPLLWLQRMYSRIRPSLPLGGQVHRSQQLTQFLFFPNHDIRHISILLCGDDCLR